MVTERSEVAPKVISLSLFNVHSSAVPSSFAALSALFFILKVCLRDSRLLTAVDTAVAVFCALTAVVEAAVALLSAVDAAVDA